MYKIEPVRPGDLIKADLVDSLISALVDLDARVAKLEQGQVVTDGVPIYAVSAQTVTVNDTLTVTGANFSVPAQSNTVTLSSPTLGTTAVTNFMAFGTPNQFSFAVPPVSGLDPAGSAMQLTIVNATGAKGTFQSPITVKPFVIVPRGVLNAVYDNLPVQQALALNAPVQIGFTASSSALLAAQYSATATVVTNDTASTPVPGWNVVFFSGGTPSTSNTTNFTLPAATSPTQPSTVPMLMQVTATSTPTGTPPVVALMVTVTCTTPGAQVQAYVLRVPIQFGQIPQPPNTTIQLTPESPAAPAGVMTLARNQPTTMIFELMTSVAGNYAIGYSMTPSAGWTQAAGATTTIANAGPSQPAKSPVRVAYTPGATAAASAALTITVTFQGAPASSATYIQQIAVTG